MGSHGPVLCVAVMVLTAAVVGGSETSIEITLDDGFTRYDHLDPESFLVARSRTFRAFDPDLDPEKK